MNKEIPFQTLKRVVLEQSGSITKQDLEVLETHFPDLQVCAKMGYGPRFCSKLSDFKLDLENNNKYHLDVYNVDQYIRELFIIATDCDLLRQLFHWPAEKTW